MFNLGLLLIKLFLLLLVLIGSCFLEVIVVAGVISKLSVEEMDDAPFDNEDDQSQDNQSQDNDDISDDDLLKELDNM